MYNIPDLELSAWVVRQPVQGKFTLMAILADLARPGAPSKQASIGRKGK